VTGGIYGISTVRETDGDVFAYLITGDTGGEVKIIQGGSGGGGSIGYPSTGTIESQTFESTTATAFNRFFLNYNLPTNTSLKLQVAVAEYPIGCDPSSLAPGVSCCDSATYQYRGPTSTTDYFTAAAGSSNLTGSVPVMASGSYTNPGRCFRYRATLGTTDSNTTPTLNDFTVNYSP
jgi:hypothetical protein